MQDFEFQFIDLLQLSMQGLPLAASAFSIDTPQDKLSFELSYNQKKGARQAPFHLFSYQAPD